MYYKKELDFMLSFFQKYHLNTTIFTQDTEDISSFDMHLRQMLGLESEYDRLKSMLKVSSTNCIYRLHDSFTCFYYFILLPEKEVPTALMIGPFTTTEMDTSALTNYIEQFSIPPQLFKSLQNYFYNVPCVKDESLFQTLMNTFGETLWNSMDNFSSEYIEYRINESILSLPNMQHTTPADYVTYDMQSIEARYIRESELIQAVAHGRVHKAESLLSNNTVAYLEQRTTDPVRNLKNYAIVLNTLLRKGAEVGMVHPYQIDHISSEYAKKIEQVSTLETGNKLMKEMVRKYCLLVKNHSMKQYSSLIQKVIKLVDTDLTADLSLKAIAKELNVNSSYLSNQFKKVTEITLTDYVNQKRIEHAILLLNTSSLHIQTIAQYCGIPDVNYFTKIFKRIVGKTPSEYRKFILGKS